MANKLSHDEITGCRKVKNSSKRKSVAAVRPDAEPKSLIPALLAVGGCLVAVPATALELADVKVHSTLGQPLRASIAYALGPNEAINDTCVTLQSGASSSGLPALRRASIIVADGVIAVTGSSVVREPMMTMRINIRCHYTARLSREYMLFVDPAGMTPQTVAAPAAAAVISPPATRPATVTARRRPVNNSPITGVTRYQVQPGDSLSVIAQRIEDRPIGLWPTVDAIFDANPDAFIDNDPNKIKAGSWLELPDFAAQEPLAIAETPAASNAPVEPVSASTAYEPSNFEAAEQPAADDAESPNTISALADLSPGDVIFGESPFVAPIKTTSDETVVIPDTELEGPVTSSSSPNVPVAVIRPATPAAQAPTNWLAWLAGGGIAIILGLLFFGRFRDRFGSAPIDGAVAPQRRQSDSNTERLEAIGDIDITDDIDIDDDSPTGENLALDADLFVGTGLQESGNVDIAPDFGFATATNVDIELPEEMSSGPQPSATDIIPPLKIDESSILMSEVLPEEDDDYDMSVMIDATKMPRPEDITERDLEAIQVDLDDDMQISGEYTVNQEVDFKVIEQDYDDEMTATQALNKEIAKAAAALADRMDEDDSNKSSELPLATVTEIDVTAQLPANDDIEISDLDDTGINPTVNMEAEDNTVEMDIEPGKIDTKTG